MKGLIALIKKIEEDIRKGNCIKAERKIPEVVLLIIDEIKNRKLTSSQIDQISDRFFNLFETQLEKKIFPNEIEDLLLHCFNLHTLIKSEEDYQNNKKFWAEISKIEKLAKSNLK